MGEEVTPAEPAVVTELPCQTITKLTETDEEDEWSDANETPKRKPKKKVAKEFDEDEDDQEVPSPPQEITLPSRKRARVKNSSKSSRR
uniref:BLVR domain-containing protein n=1 Tax=Caenorhabditis tropicalis TaxID=1561998 RepID=A0A1I7TQU2_9PELO